MNFITYKVTCIFYTPLSSGNVFYAFIFIVPGINEDTGSKIGSNACKFL